MARFRFFVLLGTTSLAAMLAANSSHAAVTISTAQTQNMSCVNGVCAPTAVNANLNTGDLANALAAGNLKVTTTGSGVQANDIVITGSFDWTSANGLTLDAFHSVTFESSVADNGSGAVSLITNDGGSGGNLSFISGGSLSFLGTGNALSINGKAYALVNSVASLAAAIRNKPSGHYALSSAYNAGPDGTYTASPVPTKFKGRLNGLGNAISNLTVTAYNEGLTGLFAYVDTAGQVSSLPLVGASIQAIRTREKTAFVAGSLVADNFGTVFNCFASGQITAKGRAIAEAGGLVGNNSGIISGSAASTSISGSAKRTGAELIAGGLASDNAGTIEQSFAVGSVSSSTDGGYVGGLVGTNGGSITDTYAAGNVNVSLSGDVGGLAGLTFTPIGNSYSLGSANAGNGGYIGGFLGYDAGQNDLSDTYWDTTTSGITNLSQGAGNIANDPGITGETTQQLQAGLPTGFDPAIWAESPSINGGLPYLIANPPQ